MTETGEELARCSESKQALLEEAASGEEFELEEKELECLEMKRQLRIAVAQINHMQTAFDLVAAQLALEMSNREAYDTRMKEAKCAFDIQPRQEIASAESIFTQGSLKTEVQRLVSSLKPTEFRVSEILKGVKASTVAMGELELEKWRLVLAAGQAELRWTEKEQELVATQEDLAGLRCKPNDAELHEKSLSGHMGERIGAKLRWEVERADATRVIDKLRQEKDRLRFNLTHVNAEVAERQRAIFDGFRRSQQALERVEARLITMEPELGGLETSQLNLENDIAVLDSTSTIGSVALEEMEHKYLEMARRVDNAEVQMYEIQAVADAVMTQVVPERDNRDEMVTADLNQLREQYALAETSLTLEQELLTRKFEELEVSAGQIKSGNASNEMSGVCNSRGELSQCLPECIPASDDQKVFAEAHLYKRQKQEIEELRGKISQKDRTIQSAKKEMQIAIANLKEAELEMDNVHRENHRLKQIELENRSLMESLSLKFKTTEEELLKRDVKIKGCQAELQKVVGVMSDWETKMHDVEIEWRKEKVALAQELTEAKLIANEKRTEAGALLQKFQHGQATLKEAEHLVDALVKANENAKHDALDWKTQKESLRIVQGWWIPERDKLVSKIARLETDMHTEQQDTWIMRKEEVNGLAATMDLLWAVDKELSELKNDHQQDLGHLAVEIWALKDDLVSRLLDLEADMTSSFEDMQTVIYELTPEKAWTLKAIPDLKLVKEQRIAQSLKMINTKLKAVENERDKYQTDLVVLNEQLQMAQTLADELEIIAAETRQAVERSKSHAEEKEEEARILERSVEELESTVYALDCQLDIVKRESERQCVAREALENELGAWKRETGLMQVTMDNQEARTVRAIQRAETSKTELDRIVFEMKNQQIQARRSVESLQQECAEKDVQLRSCKAHIAELMLRTEKQASENQQKLKALEAMVELPKVEECKVNPASGSVSKAVEKSTGKVKGAASSFKCIGSGLDKQWSSDMDEELSAAKKQIKDLETVVASRQKEVFMLNTKLAEAENMTYDVVRDLLGIKMDIAGYATMINQQQVQRIIEQARHRTVEAQRKEDELDGLRDTLNDFIEERESWLEEINRRQAQAVAARVLAEKLRSRDQTLSAENDKFREDNHALRKKVADLDDLIKKLSGQENLQQRIHQHAKTKEANNSMRLQNVDLSCKLRRMEALFARVNDELAQYRTAEGKSPFQNFDEEARLQEKLQETEENRLQLAETLIGLCKEIMQAAGIQRASRDFAPSAAMMALHQLQDRLNSLERELSDYKLKARIAVEKRRLSDLRDIHTPPVKAICTNTNFTANQQLPSPVSSSR